MINLQLFQKNLNQILFNIQLAVPKAIPKTLVSAIKYCIENKKYLDFNYSNKYSSVSGERFVICGALGRLKKGEEGF